MGLFGRRQQQEQLLLVRLNARLMPMDRGELFEDPLDERLKAGGHPADVTGGGTQLTEEGEIAFCDVEVVVKADDVTDVVQVVVSELEALGAPRGSAVLGDGGEPVAAFGTTDGLGLYLNGTDLPAEVYETSDVNDLVAAVEEALGDSGRMLSHWQGPRETALYLYGPDGEEMRRRLAPVLERFPLAQRSRLVALT